MAAFKVWLCGSEILRGYGFRRNEPNDSNTIKERAPMRPVKIVNLKNKTKYEEY